MTVTIGLQVSPLLGPWDLGQLRNILAWHKSLG